MKRQAKLAAVFFAVASSLTPMAINAALTPRPSTSATVQSAAKITQHMKIDQFLAMSPDDRATYLDNYIRKVMNTLASVNPQLPQAIHDYFYNEQPNGDSGLAKFTGVLLAEEDRAKQGQADLSKEEVDGIILALIKRDVMPKFTKSNPPPQSPAPGR